MTALGLRDRAWRYIVSVIEAISSSLEYDKLADTASLGLSRRVRIKAIALSLAAALSAGKQVTLVDVGCGPGSSAEVAVAVAGKSGVYVVGIDPSALLLGIARKRLRYYLHDVVVGVAENLPIRVCGADVVTAMYSARDFRNVVRGLINMERAARIAVAVGDIFLPRSLLKRIAVLLWVCFLAPAVAAVRGGSKGLLYKSLCETVKGWTSLEDLAEIAKKVSVMEHRVIMEMIVKGLAVGGLGYVVLFFGGKCLGSYNRR
ncbi:MAG: methyltransferase domain-containing protein [Thermoproteota archaeon]